MSQLKDLLEKSKRQMKYVKATIHVVFTVQEEVGLKGGRTSAFGLDPENVLRWLKEAAESNGIPYQLKVGAAGQTDASIIHLTREGIPTGVISTPSRYIHTPVTMMKMSDLEKSVNLIVKAVESVDRFF